MDHSDLDVHMNCIFIGEASYIYNLRHVYPEATAPRKSKSVLTEHNWVDIRILVAFSQTGMIDHSICCLDGPTTSKDMIEFISGIIVELKKRESENFFFGLNGGPTETIQPLKKKIEDARHRVLFFPHQDVLWNLVEYLFHDIQLLCHCSLLDQAKNESIEERIEVAFTKIDVPMYIIH